MSKPKVIAIVGPTASGKTALSISLAKKIKGEVVSADSRQVYVGMDIGTGKITRAEMQGIPHHLIDIADPVTVYTGADFARDANEAIESILGRKHTPIVIGGTFFYIDLLRGKMQPAPVEPNEDFRNSLAHFKDDELFAQLQEKDPKRAESIDPFNRRRLVRALEVIEALGSVPEQKSVESPYDWLIVGVEVPHSPLHDKIHDRLLQRLDAGMVKEVETLHAQGVTYERLDDLGLEYRYIGQYLQKNLTYDEMILQLETKIRQYAKRQLTWLKRDTEIEWFSSDNHEAISIRVDSFLKE
ncbi:MAG: tRNA (adenosine(37)-N6)-dimethylallyltransferase MiaA [Candidatus Pacebacteria bacterium]|nr:tRNA (adenosine(37)-N6)-dimethylallyltransferase MiaA [Candidatus Paceibacterota bacterium]MBP9842951.1 tRNA (adenosine(37)-N6)-dimethylallyltransferase MiaA [Candidatus Paceibacterota bacterium]